MVEKKAEQLIRGSSFDDLEIDLINNPREIIASIVAEEPASKVGDMIDVLSLVICRMEAALGPIRELHSELSKVDPKTSAFNYSCKDIEKMIAVDEMPCPSLLYWLLTPALEASKKGDVKVVDHYTKALVLAEPIYGNEDNFDISHGAMLPVVETYCDLLVAYVEGKTSEPPSLPEFSALTSSGIQ